MAFAGRVTSYTILYTLWPSWINTLAYAFHEQSKGTKHSSTSNKYSHGISSTKWKLFKHVFLPNLVICNQVCLQNMTLFDLKFPWSVDSNSHGFNRAASSYTTTSPQNSRQLLSRITLEQLTVIQTGLTCNSCWLLKTEFSREVDSYWKVKLFNWSFLVTMTIIQLGFLQQSFNIHPSMPWVVDNYIKKTSLSSQLLWHLSLKRESCSSSHFFGLS
jgi:hypothetical protein